ncbi:leucine-rich repeat and fibronectin type-III domain-containing protein 4 [Ornithorhynchus anatinus]|uniref:leucine-rich repeat and fibronectin type-III domain-containing protein 4 n=1 Tax=Ornithorhynchus anatinus TaxID=9258 RepID=UPI0010A75B28|nr:leucine-rich repeat and fibronectin type-III domain-containing protein 4 [Ornithorhynchus anatinus]
MAPYLLPRHGSWVPEPRVRRTHGSWAPGRPGPDGAAGCGASVRRASGPSRGRARRRAPRSGAAAAAAELPAWHLHAEPSRSGAAGVAGEAGSDSPPKPESRLLGGGGTVGSGVGGGDPAGGTPETLPGPGRPPAARGSGRGRRPCPPRPFGPVLRRPSPEGSGRRGAPGVGRGPGRPEGGGRGGPATGLAGRGPAPRLPGAGESPSPGGRFSPGRRALPGAPRKALRLQRGGGSLCPRRDGRPAGPWTASGRPRVEALRGRGAGAGPGTARDAPGAVTLPLSTARRPPAARRAPAMAPPRPPPLAAVVVAAAAAAAALLPGGAAACPTACVCQNLSESLSTLCAHRGLLSVPPDVDRRTVELRLADNFIRALGPPDFRNMSGLVDLTLSRNAIARIGARAFGDLESLRSLHLDGNRLAELGAASLRGPVNLRHLILSGNQLGRIAPGAFDDFLASLEDLDLSYNNLRRAPWPGVGAMLELHTLNLDHNLIDALPPGAFARLGRLSRLDLTSNRLATLAPDPLFARGPGAGAPPASSPAPPLSLSFGGNPLHCNCELLWLRRLPRPDELETCASPPGLAGRYFWTVPEGDFSCEPPLIARHTQRLWVLEGQRAVLRCRALGDPAPATHWVGPDDRLVANSSRARSFPNGTLEIGAAGAGDAGAYACVATNPAGEATARVELRVLALPRGGDAGGPGGRPGPSDIAASARAAAEGEGARGAGPAVAVAEVTATSGLVSWGPGRPEEPVWTFQIRYNSSEDETPIYRIIPASSRHFLLRHLIPGADYDLCVLALSPAAAPSDLPAPRLLGCARFSTPPATPLCRALRAHVLGGTLTVAVGGVLVAALLVFTVALLVRGRGGGAARLPLKLSHVQSQTNGGPGPGPEPHPPRSPPPRPQRSCSLDLGEGAGCYGYAKRLGGVWARRSHSVHGGLLAAARRGTGGSGERLEESVV